MNNLNLIYLAALQAAGIRVEIRTGDARPSAAIGTPHVRWLVALYIERPNVEGDDLADLAGKGEGGTLDDALGVALDGLRGATTGNLSRLVLEMDERTKQVSAIDNMLDAIRGVT